MRISQDILTQYEARRSANIFYNQLVSHVLNYKQKILDYHNYFDDSRSNFYLFFTIASGSGCFFLSFGIFFYFLIQKNYNSCVATLINFFLKAPLLITSVFNLFLIIHMQSKSLLCMLTFTILVTALDFLGIIHKLNIKNITRQF